MISICLKHFKKESYFHLKALSIPMYSEVFSSEVITLMAHLTMSEISTSFLLSYSHLTGSTITLGIILVPRDLPNL